MISFQLLKLQNLDLHPNLDLLPLFLKLPNLVLLPIIKAFNFLKLQKFGMLPIIRASKSVFISQFEIASTYKGCLIWICFYFLKLLTLYLLLIMKASNFCIAFIHKNYKFGYASNFNRLQIWIHFTVCICLQYNLPNLDLFPSFYLLSI